MRRAAIPPVDHGPLVRLLGRPQVHWSGRTYALTDDLPHRLLVYLAYKRDWLTREHLAALLWPWSALDRRRANLRRVLGRAREEPWAKAVEADRERVRWPVATDVGAVLQDAGDPADRLAHWSGALLEGVELFDDDPYAVWLDEERRRLVTRRRVLVLAQADVLDRGGAFGAAADLLRLLLDDDALDEEGLQRYMIACDRAGRTAEARGAYRRFADALAAELGLQPLDATRAIVETLGSAPPPTTSGAARGPETRFDREMPLVGRASVLAALARSCSNVVVLSGDAGVGKSRMATELTDGRTAIWLRSLPIARSTPFGMIAEALRGAVADGRLVARLKRLPDVWLDAVVRLIPDAALELGRPLPRANEPLSSDARDVQRLRFVEALHRALLALAGDDGAIVFDDLHGADVPSLEVFDRVARGASGLGWPPRVVATLRLADLADARETAVVLAALERDGVTVTAALEPLDAADVERLIAHISGRPVAARFTERLHVATGGNPFFVLETLRYLLVDGAVRDRAGGDADAPFGEDAGATELPIPPSVRSATVERVARLGEAARRVLEASALADAPFALESVQPATALSEWLALEGLERALAAQVLVEERSGGYRFAHDLVRRAIEQSLRPERRRLIERRLAWALQRDRAASATVAAHLERAGASVEAVRWHLRAAEEAQRVYAQRHALDYLTRAAELAEDDATRVDVHLRRADVFRQLVDHDGRAAALDAAQEASERLGDPGVLAAVAASRADAFADRGALVDTVREVNRALATCPTGDVAGEALFARGRAEYNEGHLADAHATFMEALGHVGADGALLRGQIILKGLLFCAYARGDLGAAMHYVDDAIGVLSAVPGGAQAPVAEARAVRGVLLAAMGRSAEAIAELEDAHDIARAMGDVPAQRRALLNLVKLHLDGADVATAAPLIDEGLALAADFEHVATEVAFVQASAYRHALRGELGPMLRAWRRAIDVADRGTNVEWRFYARVVPIESLLHVGDLHTCGRWLDEAAAIAREGGQPRWQAGLAVKRAWYALAEGRLDEALATAHACLADATDWPAEERGALGRVLGLIHAARGDADAVLEAVEPSLRAPTLEVALHAQALRLEALVDLGRPCDQALREAEARLAAGPLVPFEGLALERAVARAYVHGGDVDAAEALLAGAREMARALVASLAGYDALARHVAEVLGERLATVVTDAPRA